MKFAKGLRNKRKSIGYSQKFVANYLSITQQSLSKWENGISRPTIDTTLKILRFYGCSDEEVLELLKMTIVDK